MIGWFSLPLPRELSPGRIKIRRIKLVLGSRRELCNREYPVGSLEVHAISADRLRGRNMPNLEPEVLLLCGPCHREVHEACLTVAEQKEILRYRPGDMRREIRRILGYHPKRCIPPDPDISAIYEDAIRVSTHIFGV